MKKKKKKLLFGFVLFFWLGRFHVRDRNNLNTPYRNRRCILGIHDEAFHRAGIHARVTDNAPEPVDLPGFLLLADEKRL